MDSKYCITHRDQTIHCREALWVTGEAYRQAYIYKLHSTGSHHDILKWENELRHLYTCLNRIYLLHGKAIFVKFGSSAADLTAFCLLLLHANSALVSVNNILRPFPSIHAPNFFFFTDICSMKQTTNVFNFANHRVYVNRNNKTATHKPFRLVICYSHTRYKVNSLPERLPQSIWVCI